MKKLIIAIGTMLVVAGVVWALTIAGQEEKPQAVEEGQDRFGDYWYRGLAELGSYELEQARYGEIHPGEAVLIFVTEDFSKEKQVKLDRPGQSPEDALKVLKLNKTKKFNTGIYPYSMMASVFTPVHREENPHTVKVTGSSQEWCGHTFSQLNLRPGGYLLRAYSYFESEGDQERMLEQALLEDELWNAIRLSPENIPTGRIDIIPSVLYCRLKHVREKPYAADLKIESVDEGYNRLSLDYPELGRSLSIDFEKGFPHRIRGWKESYKSGFGSDAKTLETTARLKKRIMLDYWNKNSAADTVWRDSLELTVDS